MDQEKSQEWKLRLREMIKMRMLDDKSGGIASKALEFGIGASYRNQAPKKLYKYFRDDLDRFKAVENNKMWYSAPIHFNDVFDADFPVNRKAVLTGMINQVQEGGKTVRTGSKEWRDLNLVATQAISEIAKGIAPTRSEMGVSCFCESYNSLLMWAHYAHNHKGVCVEYDLLSFNDELGFSPIPVIYSEHRPCLQHVDLYNTDNVNREALCFLIDGLTTKSPEWSYENEWRIIRDRGACGEAWDDTKHGALLPSITPLSVILGCDASGAFEAAVKRYCTSRKVNLFKMEKDELEYRLIKKSVLQFDA